MACPVNHPAFHALIFLLGIIVVLSRYARAEPISHAAPQLVSFVAAGPALSEAMQHFAQDPLPVAASYAQRLL